MKSWQQALLALTTFAVLAYSSAVLFALWTAGDLGVYCLFSDSSAGDDPAGPTIAWVDLDSATWVAPQPGDRLVRVAGRDVPTIVHLQSRVAEIGHSRDEGNWPVASSETDLAALPRDVHQARLADQRWVRVEFDHENGRGEAQRVSSWLRVKRTPPATVAMSLAWFGLEVVILGIGVLVVWRRPGDPSAIVFFALCVVNVVTFMGAFHWLNLMGSRLLTYPFVLCALLLAPLTLHFYALAPRPLAWVRRWPRAALSLLYAVPAVWIVLMFDSLMRIGSAFQESNPAELTRDLADFANLIYGYLAISLGMFVAGLAALVVSFLRSRTTRERQQASWLLAGAVLATAPIAYLLYAATTDRAEFAYGPLPRAMVYATSLVFTLAYAVSIARYKLLQVGQIVNRGILYVAISFAATALFCLMVGLTTALVGRFYFSWESAVVAGMTAMLVVVALGWIRDRFQRAIDRHMHRDKYQLDKAMRRLGEAVDRLVEPRQLARQLLEAAADTVGAGRGAVYLRGESDREFRLACRKNWTLAPERIEADPTMLAELPSPTPTLARFALPGAEPGSRLVRQVGAELGCPIMLESAVMGLILLGEKLNAAPFTAEDRNFLEALARTTALALHSAQGHRTIDGLKEELQHKVHKIAEQQRRIVFLQGQLLNRGASREAAPETSAAQPPSELNHEIRGSSSAIRRLLDQVARVAQATSSVLIRGETGTGKELLARAIHLNSARRGGPFVQVHCAALSQGLLESELFGHVKGAFTGADRDKVGRFELAHGGTLFLDEIGDVNLETQTKLLRVLQEKSFERVGSTRTISVDVRLVAATHRDLEELIRLGRFREDLFYRLNVISLRCPPLRERRDDLFELALHFARVYAQQAGKSLEGFDDDALEALAAHSWPGNVRQLENAIERAVVLAEGQSIALADLPPEITSSSGAATTLRGTRRAATRAIPRRAKPASAPGASDLGHELEEIERGRVADALARAGGNKSEAARLLGVPRSTLFSKLRKLGIGIEDRS